ncbi:hypothetical protein [Fonticella tunisiensis]|uniref:hypothetical protein n=1 Tax=Fonticella tunisiensis TaxID=1096341 RepID=UPI001A9B6C23|nr:hypothetical protein [Fonticella tunisiensis]
MLFERNYSRKQYGGSLILRERGQIRIIMKTIHGSKKGIYNMNFRQESLLKKDDGLNSHEALLIAAM